MKTLIKSIFGLAMLAIMVLGYWSWFVPTASAETYDQMVYRMFAEKQQAYSTTWNCGVGCVDNALRDNAWWLEPLHKKVNAKFPSWATPITLEDLTRYAIVRSTEIAIKYEDTCKQGLIRDEMSRGRWPSAQQFDKCKPTAEWWSAQYANNVEQTRADFDVSPTVFSVNEWTPLWKLHKEWGGAY